MSKELLDNIETHLEDEKSKLAITQLVTALDEKRDLKLPAVLEEKLNLVKDNPLEAKEIKTKQDEIEKMIESGEIDASEASIELLDAVLTIEELNKFHSDGITLVEFQKLGIEISDKVFGHKHFNEDENYVYKEIDSHKEMNILSFHERKEIRKLSKKVKTNAMKNFQKLQTAKKINDGKQSEKVSDIISEIKAENEKSEKLVKELHNKAIKYSGLDKNSMTKWEQDLAIAKIIDMAEDNYTPPLGKK